MLRKAPSCLLLETHTFDTSPQQDRCPTQFLSFAVRFQQLSLIVTLSLGVEQIIQLIASYFLNFLRVLGASGSRVASDSPTAILNAASLETLTQPPFSTVAGQARLRLEGESASSFHT